MFILSYVQTRHKRIIYNRTAKEITQGIVYNNQIYTINLMMHVKPYELEEVTYKFKIMEN